MVLYGGNGHPISPEGQEFFDCHFYILKKYFASCSYLQINLKNAIINYYFSLSLRI
jgi:hypothetical protein